MNFLFYLLSTGAWISAALVLRSKNPVHSVFYLVLTFLHASGLLLLMGLEFFGLLIILVYIGALAILFLFVVILLDISSTEILAHQRGTYPVAGFLFFTLIFAILGILWQPLDNTIFDAPLFSLLNLKNAGIALNTHFTINQANDSYGSLIILGIALYGVHVDLLVLASLLLLVAMIGAVALTLKRRENAPLHDVFVQHSVDFQKVVCVPTQMQYYFDHDHDYYDEPTVNRIPAFPDCDIPDCDCSEPEPYVYSDSDSDSDSDYESLYLNNIIFR